MMQQTISQIQATEVIREYSVLIDSKDRNYQVYTDPFNYTVRCHKAIYDEHDGIPSFENTHPIIFETFRNVRYIKLETCILPKYHQIYMKKHVNEFNEIERLEPQVDIYHSLTHEHYVILSLGNDYADSNHRSTNEVLSESFAVIYYDKDVSPTHYMGKTCNGIKIFPRGYLGTINRLNIQFVNAWGEKIQCPHVDKNIQSNQECHCSSLLGDENTDCYRHNLFHPNNPIFQHHLHFKIGVYEPTFA